MTAEPELRLDQLQFHHGPSPVGTTHEIDPPIGRGTLARRHRRFGQADLRRGRRAGVNRSAVVVLDAEVPRFRTFRQGVRESPTDDDQRVFAVGKDVGLERLDEEGLSGEERVNGPLEHDGVLDIEAVGVPRSTGDRRLHDALLPALGRKDPG